MKINNKLKILLPGILGWMEVIYRLILDNSNNKIMDEDLKRSIRNVLLAQELLKEHLLELME